MRWVSWTSPKSLGPLYLLANCICGVLIIILNKYVIKHYNFHYGGLLSSLHFLATGVGLLIGGQLGLYQTKLITLGGIHKLLPLSIIYAVSIPLCDMSVTYNSLGFYQISKTTIIPATILISRLLYSEKLFSGMLLYIVPIIGGAIITGGSDAEIRPIGLVFSIGCVISTALSQLLIKRKGEELGLDYAQMLIYIVPFALVMQTVTIPLFDKIHGPGGLAEYEWTIEIVLWITLTCFMAFGFNISFFLSLQEVSPLTYQIAGQLKTMAIVMASFIFFEQPLNNVNLTGMALTLIGAIVYVVLDSPKSEASHAKDAPSKEDVKIFSASGQLLSDSVKDV